MAAGDGLFPIRGPPSADGVFSAQAGWQFIEGLDLEREAPVSRRVLERVPDGQFDWKLHERAMPMRYLAMMVATIPEWLGMVIGMDELDIAPKDGPKFQPPSLKTPDDFVKALDAAASPGPPSASCSAQASRPSTPVWYRPSAGTAVGA